MNRLTFYENFCEQFSRYNIEFLTCFFLFFHVKGDQKNKKRKKRKEGEQKEKQGEFFSETVTRAYYSVWFSKFASATRQRNTVMRSLDIY